MSNEVRFNFDNHSIIELEKNLFPYQQEGFTDKIKIMAMKPLDADEVYIKAIYRNEATVVTTAFVWNENTMDDILSLRNAIRTALDEIRYALDSNPSELQ